MKNIYGLVLALSIGIAAAQNGQADKNQPANTNQPANQQPDKLHCAPGGPTIPNTWRDMAKPEACTKIMQEQVQNELNAAITYMAMGAHFARDSINRLGFSDLFFKSASEEREHAIKIMEYLSMRGELSKSVSNLIGAAFTKPKSKWSSPVDALTDALELEASVTVNIKDIIKTCEKPDNKQYNNYHLVDYLTGVFLEEQYTGQREIAGRISTLGKMDATYGDLGEFVYDKKLLNGEL